jgi:hypothetical protein
MKTEPNVFISDIEDIRAFVQMNLDKDKYFKKVWKKALKK